MENGRWLLLVLVHHLAIDHTTLELLIEEAELHRREEAASCRTPEPFRNFVAQARLGVSREEHEAFFRELLGDVDEPTAPFGLMNVQGDGAGIEESRRLLSPEVARRVRERARALGVSCASLMHLAWGLVVARASARKDVVFGTVLFGRMQGGAHADRVLGMFINTLPVRLTVGARKRIARACERRTTCGGAHSARARAALDGAASEPVPAQTPLFSSLLNYRYSSGRVPKLPEGEADERRGAVERRANELSADLVGGRPRRRLRADGASGERRSEPSVSATSCRPAVESLLDALEQAPETPVSSHRRAACSRAGAGGRGVEPDEAGVSARARSARAVRGAGRERRRTRLAVIDGDERLTLRGAERASESARASADRARGCGAGDYVASGARAHRRSWWSRSWRWSRRGRRTCRSTRRQPGSRQALMLSDCGAEGRGREALARARAGARERRAAARSDVDDPGLADESAADPNVEGDGQSAAYVMYTSGSTGRPKGVVVPQRAVSRLVRQQRLRRVALERSGGAGGQPGIRRDDVRSVGAAAPTERRWW